MSAPRMSEKASPLRRKLNTLAREFYQMEGYVVAEDYDFEKAQHPQEQRMWELALLSYKHFMSDSVDPGDLEDEP